MSLDKQSSITPDEIVFGIEDALDEYETIIDTRN